MSQRRALCFVDDSKPEVDRIRKYLDDRFDIGAGPGIEAALQDLQERTGRKKPDIFLIDMYAWEGSAGEEAEEKLARARARYLRAEAEFYKTLAELGQTDSRGFRNLHMARNRYRVCRVPVAFFTRKGTLDKVAKAFEEAPECTVLKKPDPEGTEILSSQVDTKPGELNKLYDEAFARRRDNLADDIGRIIRRFSWRSRYGDLLLGVFLGVTASVLTDGAIWAIRTLFCLAWH